MCEHCTAVEMVDDGRLIFHIGYSETINDEYQKLLEGEIVVEKQNGTKQKVAQRDFLTLWDTLCKQYEFGYVDKSVPQEQNQECAVPECHEKLVTVPGVDAECMICGVRKHEKITQISENRDDIGDKMKLYFGESGPGNGKTNNAIELAIRAGLQCPTGHWVCANCLTYERGELDRS